MKKLIFAGILVAVAALFTACGGAGSPGGSGDDDERMGHIKTTSNSPWASYHFELYDEDLAAEMPINNYQYIIPEGSWIATYISVENNMTYMNYYEFTSPADVDGRLTVTKQVRLFRSTKTDEEIAEMEDMEPNRFSFEYLMGAESATSYDYYMDGNDFVVIYEYTGNDIYSGYINIEKEMSAYTAGKVTSDNSSNPTKILQDKYGDDSVRFYFQKQN